MALVQQDSGKWNEDRIADYAGNLAHIYKAAGPMARNLGHQFYPSWHEDAQSFGQRSGTSTEHGATALARLSPQTHEALNRMQALQLLHVNDADVGHLLVAHDASQQAAQHARDLKASGSSKEAIENDDEFRMYKAQSTAARGRARLHGTPLNNQSSRTILTALDVRNGVHPHPLSQLVGKIGDYAGAINDPRNYKRIAGDTHIYHAAVTGGNSSVPYEDVDKLFSKSKNAGVYEGLQRVHHFAYGANIDSGHVNPEETPPNAHMATIWFGHRSSKMLSNKDAEKSALARHNQITGLLNHPRAREWDPARNGLRPIR